MSRSHSPSIRMVASRAGVSVSTVSNVLNGKASVSPDMIARVNKAVQELGYVVDIAASRLRSRKSLLAGVIVPDLTNPMFAAFVSTLEHLARVDGYDLVVVSARNDAAEEADRLANIRSWRPAGLIAIPCDGAFKSRLPAGFAIPTVLADRIPDQDEFDLVAVDNAVAAGAVARHLDEEGFDDCLVVATRLSISNVRERWEGVQVAVKRMALELLEIGIDDPVGLDAFERRLRERPKPQAIFALDHGTALATYRLVAEMGLQIPADIAFASFDDMEWMQLVGSGVTAVRQPVEAMAEQAWSLLSRRLAGETGEPVTRRLRCAIEIRGSTVQSTVSRGGETDLSKREEKHGHQ